MAIWRTPLSLEALKDRNRHTFCEHLSIEFTEIGEDYLKATMPVDHRVHQAIGIMNGGASCALAETVGSNAANYVVDIKTHYCVGLDINTNHLRPVREGLVTATARPFHLGRTTQVWGIEIHDQQGKLVSVTRLTMAVIAR